jgi:hypothetical protein
MRKSLVVCLLWAIGGVSTPDAQAAHWGVPHRACYVVPGQASAASALAFQNGPFSNASSSAFSIGAMGSSNASSSAMAGPGFSQSFSNSFTSGPGGMSGAMSFSATINGQSQSFARSFSVPGPMGVPGYVAYPIP